MIIRLGIVLLFSTVVFGGVFAMKYFGQKGMNQYFDNMPSPPATISSAAAEVTNWAQTIEAAGTLTAVNGIEVTTEAAGIVQSIRFESGDQVKKGDVLITLDAQTDRADLRTFEAQSALAKSEYERLKKLYELDSVSKAELDRAESEAAQSKARVQAQRAKIAQKVIRAPFSGELGIRKVDLGEYIAPGTPIVGLQALDPLYVDFTLPEQRINRLQPGMKARVEVDLYAGEVFEAEVLAIDSQVNTETRNFKVRAKLPNTTGLLRPGVFANVSVALPGSEDTLIIPRTAISYNAYGNSVFVVLPEEKEVSAEAGEQKPAGLIVRQRFVKTGKAQGDFVEVLEGLAAGDEVATSGLLKLRNNKAVVINNDMQPAVSLTPKPADS